MNRIFSTVILSAAAFFSPMMTWADYSPESYTLSDDGKTLAMWKGSETVIDMNSDSVLKEVTAIGRNAFSKTAITKIYVGENVETIDNWAFMDCLSLEGVGLPAGLKSLKLAVFSGCTALYDISLPSNLEEIGNSTFYNCTSLIVMGVPDGIKDLPAGCFNSCTSLGSVSLPAGLRTIGEEAFKNCTSLTAMALPEGLKSIGAYAFEACEKMMVVIFGSQLETVESSAFSGTGLLSADLGNITAPVSFGYNVFEDCKQLTSATLPPTPWSISGGMFQNCTSLQEIVIPDSYTEVPVKLCYGCSSLKKLTLGENVEVIKNGAFFECSSLDDIVFNEKLEQIDWNVFYGCSALKSLTLPQSVKSVDDYTFSQCTSLETVHLGRNVETLGTEVFSMNPSLRSVVCEAVNPPTLGSYAFYKANQENAVLSVELGSIGAYKEAEQWKEFGTIQALCDGIEGVVARKASISARGCSITVEAASETDIRIYTAEGMCVASETAASYNISLPCGVYIVRAGIETAKVVLN